jgi:hypothetical protein
VYFLIALAPKLAAISAGAGTVFSIAGELENTTSDSLVTASGDFFSVFDHAFGLCTATGSEAPISRVAIKFRLNIFIFCHAFDLM